MKHLIFSTSTISLHAKFVFITILNDDSVQVTLCCLLFSPKVWKHFTWWNNNNSTKLDMIHFWCKSILWQHTLKWFFFFWVQKHDMIQHIGIQEILSFFVNMFLLLQVRTRRTQQQCSKKRGGESVDTTYTLQVHGYISYTWLLYKNNYYFIKSL